MDFVEVGRSIREARKASRRSQAELARSLGMENGTIAEIGVRKLDALCRAVGLDLFVGPRRARPTLRQLREERRGGGEG
jgi:transcriptional regulator with XRE-family HTH domain